MFPALCALIRHPDKGYLLYDTGYSDQFFKETKSFPECLYAKVTPVIMPPEERLLQQLEARGLQPSDIQTIIISHFHADHVAGLHDFPQANFISFKADYLQLQRMKKISQVRNGYLPGLLPADFEQRNTSVESTTRIKLPSYLSPIKNGYDLLGDRSILGLDLPGHASSQLGVVFRDQNGRRVFLIADASWSIEALASHARPSKLAYRIFSDSKKYDQTFHSLAELYHREKDLRIIPSHCLTTWNEENRA